MDKFNDHSNPEGIPKAHLLAQISAFNMKAGINLALFIASGALLNKKTWTNADYATHWVWVAGLADDYLSDDAKIVGILHDVVEDSDWTFEDLEAVGFSVHIIEGVRAVTKKSGEKYLDAVKRCSANRLGRLIKMRDNRNNMDLTRSFATPTPKQKYLYHISYSYLNAVEQGEIPAGLSIWKFLQMDKYKALLVRESYAHIANAVSETVPAEIIAKMGRVPRLQKSNHARPSVA